MPIPIEKWVPIRAISRRQIGLEGGNSWDWVSEWVTGHVATADQPEEMERNGGKNVSHYFSIINWQSKKEGKGEKNCSLVFSLYLSPHCYCFHFGRKKL